MTRALCWLLFYCDCFHKHSHLSSGRGRQQRPALQRSRRRRGRHRRRRPHRGTSAPQRQRQRRRRQSFVRTARQGRPRKQSFLRQPGALRHARRPCAAGKGRRSARHPRRRTAAGRGRTRPAAERRTPGRAGRVPTVAHRQTRVQDTHALTRTQQGGNYPPPTSPLIPLPPPHTHTQNPPPQASPCGDNVCNYLGAKKRMLAAAVANAKRVLLSIERGVTYDSHTIKRRWRRGEKREAKKMFVCETKQ